MGVPIGLLLAPTEWEKKARRLQAPWLPFGHGSAFALALGIFVKVALSVGLLLLLPYAVLNWLGFIPLRGQPLQFFFLIYLLCLGTGKLIRYCYWRWSFRGQLV
ncbi:hypothetical protein SNE35_24830 [Paucibacter sp. R3-3]|uniref:Uncharacterized protein n=1 Tax=Roseateles agri TaxID=3098619 RepID=A0ABU5DN75_9BURK|nr:hypothetical protein [Paucibacter sp. R3-3]MDY0747752.1 hypothetical protein [Paucibacter sp. R3-3]